MVRYKKELHDLVPWDGRCGTEVLSYIQGHLHSDEFQGLLFENYMS